MEAATQKINKLLGALAQLHPTAHSSAPMGPWSGGPTRIRPSQSLRQPQQIPTLLPTSLASPCRGISSLCTVHLSYLAVTTPHFHQVPLKTLMLPAQRLEA